MQRIRDQRERARDDAADDLRQREPQIDRDGTENPAVARVRVDVVMVWVSQIDGSVRSVSVP